MIALKRVWQAGIGILVAVALVIAPSCGSNDFLGLEDYQRDLLMGGLAVALLSQQAQGTTNGEEPAPAPIDGRDGVDGLNCWDLNGNGVGDPEEDINGDGDYDALDCQGAQGATGPAGADGQDGPAGADGQAGADGLSCWDLNGNGRGDPSEDMNGDGDFNALDCQGPAGPGGSGPPGADGPEFFDIFIDDFFTVEGAPEGDLRVVPLSPVSIHEPALGVVRDPYTGTTWTGIVAYRMAIPNVYEAGNDVTMRLFFYQTSEYQTGEFDNRRFVFTMDARRLRAGSDIEDYGSRRWIHVHTEEVNGVLANGAPGVFLVVDLPINTAAGLDLERDPDLAPGGRLEVADFLAFELNTYCIDGRTYHLLGVEFFESVAGLAATSGATIFFDEVNCEYVDCNDNGIDDVCDIDCSEPGSYCYDFPGCGISDDCNENGVPDECDIASGTSQDCQPNGIPDECDGGCVVECTTDDDCPEEMVCVDGVCVEEVH